MSRPLKRWLQSGGPKRVDRSLEGAQPLGFAGVPNRRCRRCDRCFGFSSDCHVASCNPRFPASENRVLNLVWKQWHGKLRLDSWFATAGPFSAIRRLCRDVAAGRPSLTFVIAAVNPNGSAARASLISATGGEHYRFPAERRRILVRRANRKWADISPRIASAEAVRAILRQTAARWDLRLAGVSSGKRPYRPAAENSEPVFFRYMTKRRLVAVGPSAEIEWLIARARGDFLPLSRPGSPWRERADLAFHALAELLPRDVRPSEVPPELEYRGSWIFSPTGRCSAPAGDWIPMHGPGWTNRLTDFS